MQHLNIKYKTSFWLPTKIKWSINHENINFTQKRASHVCTLMTVKVTSMMMCVWAVAVFVPQATHQKETHVVSWNILHHIQTNILGFHFTTIITNKPINVYVFGLQRRKVLKLYFIILLIYHHNNFLKSFYISGTKHNMISN